MPPSPFTIRRALEDDATRLATEERTIARVPGRLASRPEEIADEGIRGLIAHLNGAGRGVFLVAEDNGVPVGHAFLEPLPLAVTAHVVRLTLAVHEGHARRGIGRALMNALLTWARGEDAVGKVELQVRASNTAAIALYLSLGFVEEGRKTKRIKLGPGHYVDDVYMAMWVGGDVARETS